MLDWLECVSHEDSRHGAGELRADQSVSGRQSVHISTAQALSCYHDACEAEVLAKTSTETTKHTVKMIIRDILDDDIEVAIKVGLSCMTVSCSQY